MMVAEQSAACEKSLGRKQASDEEKSSGQFTNFTTHKYILRVLNK